jgi:2-dehydro-3-deoxyphosphogluconate aldolase / (4S)-4-hydroxy-2-oxoglutarate aldolase
MKELQDLLQEIGLIPVIAIDHVRDAIGLADALLEGGIPVAEITFRTEAAAEVIASLHERRPELLVGAGTVFDATHLSIAQAAGAKFALSPGLDPLLIQEAQRIGIPYFPGGMTPTDFQAGSKFGVMTFKFFPAAAAGGIPLLRAIMAPFSHLGVRVIPTGGVTAENLAHWLSEPAVLAVGATAIASREAIVTRDWAGIRARAKEAAATVLSIRSSISL